MCDLEQRLNVIADKQGFDIHWQIYCTAENQKYNRGEKIILPSASVRKISIMMAAFNAVYEGRLKLDSPVTITAELQKNIVSGICQYMTPGLVIPMRDAILQMIITSDNICTYEVMKSMELNDLTDYCKQIGMVDTIHRTKLPPLGLSARHSLQKVTTTTNADQVMILDLILRGTKDERVARALGVSIELCKMALDFLTWQRFRTMIPRLLPTGTVTACKSGWGERGWMDSGIIFKGEQPLYIMSATTDKVPVTMPDGLPGRVAATRAIAEISRACWDEFA